MKSFHVELAEQYGINAALMAGLIRIKASTSRNVREDRRWFFLSQRKFSLLFPFLSVDQIRLALEKIRSAGLVKVGNFNRYKGFDRTHWYSPETALEKAMTGRKIYFSEEDACAYGVDAAIVLNHVISSQEDEIIPARLSRFLVVSVKRINKAVKALREAGAI